MPPPLQQISGLIPPEHLEDIKALGGDQGVSSGLRIAVAAGLAALGGDSTAVLPVVDDLHALADRLAQICGRRTASGAWWAACDEAMPVPEQLASHGDVVASPGRVVLAGYVGALLVDINHNRIEAQHGDRLAAQPVEVDELVGIAPMLSASLVRLGNVPPGRPIDLGAGLVIQRLDNGLAQLALHGVEVIASQLALLKFSAELHALVAAGVNNSMQIRSQLNQQLQEVTP